MKKLTQEEFIAKAVAVHGVGRYDYSQTVYVRAQQKLTIFCPKHGPFEQKANSHTNGNGCPTCGRAKGVAAQSLSASDFIVRARKIHGDRYDYSKTIYTPNCKNVQIICRVHGAFQQYPYEHLKGSNCRKCAFVKRGRTNRKGLIRFVEHANKTHNYYYDYSLAIFRGDKIRLTIICPKHGSFEQIPNAHTNGSGCTACAYASRILKNTYKKEDFVNKAKLIHGSIYDYSQVKYALASDIITIICPEHGAFRQQAGKHMDGHGCHTCGQLRTKQAGSLTWIQQAAGSICTLYLLRLFFEGECFYKVGITKHSVKHRYQRRDSLASYQYEILVEHQSDTARVWDWEQSILETFAHLRYKPKVPFPGESECFSSCEEALAIFPL